MAEQFKLNELSAPLQSQTDMVIGVAARCLLLWTECFSGCFSGLKDTTIHAGSAAGRCTLAGGAPSRPISCVNTTQALLFFLHLVWPHTARIARTRAAMGGERSGENHDDIEVKKSERRGLENGLRMKGAGMAIKPLYLTRLCPLSKALRIDEPY